MARPPVLSGELREGGAIELLRELEQRRITGVLRFESDSASGEIELYGGEIAVQQPAREDGRDPVDVLLGLGPGRYQVTQRLPVLSVSRGDDYAKRGSLAVHVPADLMTYCEQAGLTGTLELRHEGHRAEAIYDAGELLAIELDGRGEADLSEVFGWEQGSFRIELDPGAPARFREENEAPTIERPAVRKREDTRQFLRVVEMALADVVQESERARSPTRTSPPLPPPPKARPRPATLPAPPARSIDEHTVRLIYLGGEPPEVHDDARTRHVSKGEAELALTEARPERRRASLPEPRAMADDENDVDTTSTETEAESSEAAEDESTAAPEASSKPSAPEASKPSEQKPAAPQPAPLVAFGGAAAWAVGFVLLALVILAVLAHLPPVQ